VSGNGLLSHARNEFSQNGEDGVLARLLDLTGPGHRTCCEFGAWDGIHFSNTRALVLKGWRGIFIEGDPGKFAALEETYTGNAAVACIRAWVDDGPNRLSLLFAAHGLADLAKDLDVLSIDVDGPDFEIFSGLDLLPTIVVVEANAGHPPDRREPVEASVARENVGQPLGRFTAVARDKGYGLAAYTGNAIYLREPCFAPAGLRPLTDCEAYEEFLAHLDREAREWLWLVNRGLVPPFHAFGNPRLGRAALGLTRLRMGRLFLSRMPGFLATCSARVLRRALGRP